MAQVPETHDVASGFVEAKAPDVWQRVSDLDAWPGIFPGWIAAIEHDDDRSTATGPRREKFDLYPTADAEQFKLDVEVVDELGSADVLRLRVLDMPGGSLVIVAHGRLKGTSDVAWQEKRSAIADGLAAL